jgi:ribosome-binding protein aMBF1 (putative translation factor)
MEMNITKENYLLSWVKTLIEHISPVLIRTEKDEFIEEVRKYYYFSSKSTELQIKYNAILNKRYGHTPQERCSGISLKLRDRIDYFISHPLRDMVGFVVRTVICVSTVKRSTEIQERSNDMIFNGRSNNMIFNERQYITTKARINDFGKAIAKLKTSEESPDPNQKLRRQVHLDALNSQLEELQEEITEYEALKTGDIKGVTINSFEEWPEVLIKARIAKGWSQEQFANILEVHPQQIQRDESTRYAGSSLRKIIAVQKALGITVREEVTFN